MKPQKLLHLAVAILLIATCGCNSHRAATLMQRATAIVEQHPDSALLLLDSIAHPHRLPKSQRMEYELRYLQVQDKANKPIAYDTTIFSVATYYQRKKDKNMAALALFYCARVYQEQKKYEDATKDYLRANDYALLTQDYNLLGMINGNLAKLNYDRLHTNKAVQYYQKAYSCFQKARTNNGYEVWMLKGIGSCYLLSGETDSAFLYFNQALTLSEKHPKSMQAAIHQSVGLALRLKGLYPEAKKHFRQAATLGIGSQSHQLTLYSNLGRMHLNAHQLDSARYYALQIIQQNQRDSIEPAKLASAYRLLSDIEAGCGSYQKALKHHIKYSENLARAYEATMELSVWEVQQKYQHEILSNKNNELVIEKQRIAVICMALLIVAIFTGAYFYTRKIASDKQLEDARRNIDALRQLACNINDKDYIINDKERQLQNLIIQQLNLMKRVASMEHSPQALNTINAENDNSSWSTIYKAINEAHSGVLTKLREQYPLLTASEVKICCLAFAHMNNTEISAITNLSIKTIQNKQSVIRKKMGLTGSTSIKTALQNLITE